MKRFICLLIVPMLLVGTNVMAQDAPIRIALKDVKHQLLNIYNPRITITSIADSVVINDILVNKGHCEVGNAQTRKSFFPKKLQYSQFFHIDLDPCNVIRIEVKTNQGDWSLEY